jgi:predicted DCC family thiol-disulfide oxidoreductase YuxK
MEFDRVTPQVTVWFDGGCPLCRSEIALYQRLDRSRGRVAFLDLTGVSDDLCPLDRGELLARFHARGTDGTVVSGMAAFGLLWSAVTPFQPLGWLMRVGHRSHRAFLQVRPALMPRRKDAR